MLISIDGNIGSGKSTLLTNLEEEYTKNRDNTARKLIFTQEPVKTWQPYLNNFYEDMENNGLSLQMKILKHHLCVENGKNSPNNNLLSISERSTTSCINIFGRHLLENNLLKKIDFDLMIDYAESFGTIPDVYIYIDTPPSVCLERINKRNRKSEDSIPISYLESLDKLYRNLYCKKPILDKYSIIDGNQSPQEVYRRVTEIINIYLDKDN